MHYSHTLLSLLRFLVTYSRAELSKVADNESLCLTPVCVLDNLVSSLDVVTLAIVDINVCQLLQLLHYCQSSHSSFIADISFPLLILSNTYWKFVSNDFSFILCSKAPFSICFMLRHHFCCRFSAYKLVLSLNSISITAIHIAFYSLVGPVSCTVTTCSSSHSFHFPLHTTTSLSFSNISLYCCFLLRSPLKGDTYRLIFFLLPSLPYFTLILTEYFIRKWCFAFKIAFNCQSTLLYLVE